MPAKRPPRYPSRQHKSGQARIKVDGKTVYLGVFGSPASHLRYQQVLAEWYGQQSGGAAAMPIATRMVGEVLALFLAAAKSGDRPTSLSHLRHTERLARLLVEAGMSERQAAAFDADCLEVLRRRWLGQFSRRYAIRQLVRIRTIWRWAERKRLIPAGSWGGLMTLRLGSGEAARPVPPVPKADLAKTMAQLARIPRAMVQVQLLCGARPSEILGLRPELFDRSGPVWTADLGREHKGGWRGHDRVLYFGPQAQAILTPFMLRAPDAYLFDPSEAAAEFARAHGRRLPLRRQRPTSARYSYWGYRQAIKRACLRAGVPIWGPARLRHNAASRLAAEFGPEVARTILGHRDLTATRHYIADNLALARKAMEQAG